MFCWVHLESRLQQGGDERHALLEATLHCLIQQIPFLSRQQLLEFRLRSVRTIRTAAVQYAFDFRRLHHNAPILSLGVAVSENPPDAESIWSLYLLRGK